MSEQFTKGRKGQLSALTAGTDLYVGIQLVAPGVTWDISCFGLDTADRLSDDRYFVFYNQPKSPEESVQLLGAQAGDTESFRVTLDRVPETIGRLSFCAALDGPGTASQLQSGYLRLVAGGQEVMRYAFTGADFGTERAIIIADLYRKGVWRVGAVGQGFAGGLADLIRSYGGQVDDEPAPATAPAGPGQPPAAPPQPPGAPVFAPPPAPPGPPPATAATPTQVASPSAPTAPMAPTPPAQFSSPATPTMQPPPAPPGYEQPVGMAGHPAAPPAMPPMPPTAAMPPMAPTAPMPPVAPPGQPPMAPPMMPPGQPPMMAPGQPPMTGYGQPAGAPGQPPVAGGHPQPGMVDPGALLPSQAQRVQPGAMVSLQKYREAPTTGRWTQQNSKLVKVTLGPEAHARRGSMVAYQGNVEFDHKGSGGLRAKFEGAMTGQGLKLMTCRGTGEVFLAEDAADLHIVDLQGHSLCINANNVLAFDATLQTQIQRIESAGIPGGGMFHLVVSGHGTVVVMTKGTPVTLMCQGPTFADMNAVVAWTAGMRVSVSTQVRVSRQIYAGASGESLALQFMGMQGHFVVVQPYEV